MQTVYILTGRGFDLQKKEVIMPKPARLLKPMEEIRHQDLVDMKDNHLWKECSHCKGSVPLSRNLKTMNLEVRSNCLLCGQQFHFIDIEENNFELIYKKA